MDRGISNFARLYEEHLDAVYGFLFYRVRDRELAEDLTQVTFEKALRGWARFDPRRSAERTWLLVIARNTLIDHSRRNHPAPTDEIDERLLPSVEGPEAASEPSQDLLTALAVLSERDREIVSLRFGADLAGPQIAAITGLTTANVQQVLSRSLRRLRAELEPQPRLTSSE